MPTPPTPTVHVARSGNDQVRENVIAFGGPWVFLRLFDHDQLAPLAGESFTLRGATSGHSSSGESDDDGIVYVDRLPDDHYELECRGAREAVPLYRDADRSSIVQPWPLRMRDIPGERERSESP